MSCILLFGSASIIDAIVNIAYVNTICKRFFHIFIKIIKMDGNGLIFRFKGYFNVFRYIITLKALSGLELKLEVYTSI